MKYILLLSVFFSFIACESSLKKKYKLTDEQLTSVMFDLHIAEAILPEFEKIHQDSIRDLYWSKMSETYGMSEIEIREEIELLESDGEKLKIILDQVKIMADSIK